MGLGWAVGGSRDLVWIVARSRSQGVWGFCLSSDAERVVMRSVENASPRGPGSIARAKGRDDRINRRTEYLRGQSLNIAQLLREANLGGAFSERRSRVV
jgi:hypothetical protein